jgi:hypothetical protein
MKFLLSRYLRISIFLIFIFTPLLSFGQQFFRIKADFSIKEKNLDGTHSLTMGTVYYDKIHDKIIYDIHFPEKQTLILTDSVMAVVKDNKIVERKKAPNNNKFSIFSLSLNGGLESYGLENSMYKIGETTKDKDMVITTWYPPKKLKDTLGKVVISQKKRSIYGIVFFDSNENIAGKQFFKEYMNVSGLKFPTEVVNITYAFGKEFFRVTTFKNVVVDELENDKIYNFYIPL